MRHSVEPRKQGHPGPQLCSSSPGLGMFIVWVVCPSTQQPEPSSIATACRSLCNLFLLHTAFPSTSHIVLQHDIPPSILTLTRSVLARLGHVHESSALKLNALTCYHLLRWKLETTTTTSTPRSAASTSLNCRFLHIVNSLQNGCKGEICIRSLTRSQPSRRRHLFDGLLLPHIAYPVRP